MITPLLFSTKKIELIFHQVSLKFCGYLKNNNNETIFLQFLREDLQIYILNIVLEEFLFLVLQLRKFKKFKSNSPFFKTDFFLKLLIVNSENRLLSLFPLKIKKINYKLNDALWLMKILEVEENICIKILFNYLILENTKFRDDKKISDKFTRILIEHIVLKVSETLTRLFLTQRLFDLSVLKNYSKNNLIFNKLIIQFRNNLYWSSYFNLLLVQPKNVHNNIHPIWLIINKKICTKYIYVSKTDDDLDFTLIQSFILLYFEIVDFFQLKLKNMSFKLKKDY